ncbi:MAG: ribosome maturation factor RimP [Nitrospirae bacterium]|nr:ribosome maturation factor RimP [Nitrospirota bacterium]
MPSEGARSQPSEVADRVTRVAAPIAAALGIEVVAVRYGGGKTGGTVRITIDKPSGVTLDECARVSRAVGHALDVEDPIEHRYTLEVSSPGLDRALEEPSDYQKSVGRLVRVKTRAPWEGPRVVTGRLKGIEADSVCVADEMGQEWAIPWSAIVQARLEVEW